MTLSVFEQCAEVACAGLAERLFDGNLIHQAVTIQAKSGRMLLRLTRSIRVEVGWLVAMAYLFCVLAPGAALAFGNGPAPCFGDELPVAFAPSMQAHMGGAHDHTGMHVHDQADASGAPHHKHHGNGKTSPGPCCAMLCVTALPADPPTIAKPSPPASLCASEAYVGLSGRAPPLLYRPPIV